MEEVRYMISEASKKVDVKDHVLRYWEDELKLPIARNEMGHRYYKESDIELLKVIKQMKEQGYQLKAVKMALSDFGKLDSSDSLTAEKLKEEINGRVNEMCGMEKNTEQEDGTSLVMGEVKNEIKEQTNDKMGQFKAIMNHIILEALKENNTTLTDEISENVTDGVIKEMGYLMRLQEEKEEERYKKFDMTLRDYQKSRMMAASSLDGKGRKKSKFFKKNKVYI